MLNVVTHSATHLHNTVYNRIHICHSKFVFLRVHHILFSIVYLVLYMHLCFEFLIYCTFSLFITNCYFSMEHPCQTFSHNLLV